MARLQKAFTYNVTAFRKCNSSLLLFKEPSPNDIFLRNKYAHDLN